MSSEDQSADAGSVAEKIDLTARNMELSDPDFGFHRIDRAINRIVEFIGVVALSGIVAVVFANATSRYLLGGGFSWGEEMVQMMIPWLAMTGVFLSVRRGTMIRIDFFYEKLSGRLRRFVVRAGLAFNVAVLGLLAWVSFDFVRLFGGDMALYVGLPMGVSTSALVFGAAGAALAFAAQLVASVLQDGEPQ
jgi:TRAP-type C4-dicarboxylate transport system permease small subunit